MKKLILFVITTFVLFGTITANAYTVFFGVDNTLDFSQISGFGFDVVGASPDDLTLTVRYQGTSVDVAGESRVGGVPKAFSSTYPWEIFATMSGFSGFDWSFGTFPLEPGIILSLDGVSEFTLENFVLSNSNDSDGMYRLPYFLNAVSLDGDGALYMASASTTVIPIPSTVLLLGSGLFGLVALRRKRS